MYKDVSVVDENDVVIGAMSLPDAYRQGKILRVARVVLLNSNRQVLLQKRGPGVIAPGLWQETASGHVDYDDTYELTAYKELQEEMGITGVELRQIDYFFKAESSVFNHAQRFQAVFFGSYDGDVTPNEEVAEHQWINFNDLKNWFSHSPHEFTASMSKIVELIDQTD